MTNKEAMRAAGMPGFLTNDPGFGKAIRKLKAKRAQKTKNMSLAQKLEYFRKLDNEEFKTE